MAKNMNDKKKRIAHNRAFNEDNEMFPGHYDIVSSIMHDMDDPSTSVFKPSLEEPSKMFPQKKTQTILIPSTGNGTKFRKFGPSRPPPLMQKCQKDLKQLKHNRKMPKPRAHLAGFNNSLPAEKSKAKFTIPKRSEKYQNNVANKLVAGRATSSKVNESKVNNHSLDKTKKASKQHEHSLDKTKKAPTQHEHSLDKTKIASTQHKPQTKRNDSSVEESSDVEDNFHKEAANDSSEHTDEFEKFIQEEKKGLKKKSTSQKKCTKKQKSQTKTRKQVSNIISTDSESSDEAGEPYHKKKKRFKRTHKVQEPRQSSFPMEESSSETEANMNDDTFHDSKSDSADDMQLTSIPHNSSFSEQADSNLNPAPEIKSLLHKPCVSPLVGSDQLDVLHKRTEIPPLMGSDQLGVLHKRTGITSLMDIEQPSTSHETSSTTKLVSTDVSTLNDSTQKDSNKSSVFIDLTESDNECDTLPKIIMVSSQHKSDSASYSEESDVELVHVIAYPLKKDSINESSIKSEKADQTPHSNTKLQNIDKPHVEKVDQTPCSNTKPLNTPKPHAEKVDQTPCRNTKPLNTPKPHTELQIPVNNAYEIAAFSTDICQQFDEEKDNKVKMKKFDLDNDVFQSSSSNSEDAFVFSKVKEEPCDDDCEIILDIASTSNSTKKLPNAQISNNKSIKTEEDSMEIDVARKNSELTQKEQKLHEVACSNLRNLATVMSSKDLESLENERMTGPTTEDIGASLLILKKEFATYQEILDTEQYVESTFKLLEQRQAEKLMSIKSRIQILLESSSVDDSVKIQNAMNTLNHSVKVPSAAEQGLKAHTDINFLPLSSIPPSDIKPTLPELQSALKMEPSSSGETNTMSFGEKCTVCAKDATAACLQCAKVFFCSNECGKKYWDDGHKNVCNK